MRPTLLKSKSHYKNLFCVPFLWIILNFFYTSEPLRAYYGTPLPSVTFFYRPKQILGAFQTYRTRNQRVKKVVCMSVSVCMSVKFIITNFLCLIVL